MVNEQYYPIILTTSNNNKKHTVVTCFIYTKLFYTKFDIPFNAQPKGMGSEIRLLNRHGALFLLDQHISSFLACKMLFVLSCLEV